MKTCSKCGVPKELTEFYKDAKREDGLYGCCKPCVQKQKAACQCAKDAGHKDSRAVKKFIEDSTGKKQCSGCGEVKPLEEFGITGGRHRADCRACQAKYQRDCRAEDPQKFRERSNRWKHENPEKNAAYKRKTSYGISEEQYQSLLESQGRRCAICNDPFTSTYTTHLDHCHETKKIRGVLCVTCNTGLGKFSDSPELLQKALAYLQKNS